VLFSIMQTLHVNYYEKLVVVIIYFTLLFNLFLLEGLQVAGLNIKAKPEHKLSLDEMSKDGSSKEIILFFKENFDSFVAGRQILTIATVVTMATLLGYLEIPVNHWAITALSQIYWVGSYLEFLDSSYVNFLFAILMPAWFSQLLPQYLADQKPLWFIKLPFASLAIRLTAIVSQSRVGVPAQSLALLLKKRIDS